MRTCPHAQWVCSGEQEHVRVGNAGLRTWGWKHEAGQVQMGQSRGWWGDDCTQVNETALGWRSIRKAGNRALQGRMVGFAGGLAVEEGETLGACGLDLLMGGPQGW